MVTQSKKAKQTRKHGKSLWDRERTQRKRLATRERKREKFRRALLDLLSGHNRVQLLHERARVGACKHCNCRECQQTRAPVEDAELLLTAAIDRVARSLVP